MAATKQKRKNALAVGMAKLRWKGISKAERSRQMTEVVRSREEKRAKKKAVSQC